MLQNRVKSLFKEKASLLKEWSKYTKADKVKILIRIMDIEDELVELEELSV